MIPLPVKSELKSLYKTQRMTQREVAYAYDVSVGTIQKWLKHYNIETNCNSVYWQDRGHPGRKYKEVNLDKLSKIKNKDSAYLLGYLCWAGSVKNRFDQYVLTVHRNDRKCLEKFKSFLNLPHDIKERKTSSNGGYAISISQKGVTDVFSKWYYTSFTFKKFPPKMPKELLPYYLRGYFERHGHVDKTRTFTISGPTKKFVKDFKECLSSVGIDGVKIVINKPLKGYTKEVYRLRFSAQAAVKFYKYIYNNNYTPGHRRKNDLMEVVRYQRSKRTK